MGRILVYGGHGFLPIEAMARGIAGVSPSSVVRRGASLYGANDYESCEVCVLFGQKDPMDRVLHDQRGHGTPVLVIDLGYLKRGNLPAARATPTGVYWSVNRNGLNGWGDPPRSPMPADRWKDLNIPIKQWQPAGTHFLVCGQKPHDAAIDGVNPQDWLIATVARVRACTDAPIRWRPHPEDLTNRRLKISGDNITRSVGGPLADDLVDCAGVIAYNSNSLVEALLAGIPIYRLGRGSVISAEMGHTELTPEMLATPSRPDRTQFFADLAYRQWTIPEMEEGLPWQHFFDPKGSVVVRPASASHKRSRSKQPASAPLPDSSDPSASSASSEPPPIQDDFLSPESLVTTIR